MEERSIETLSLDGGWLCLNFINTVHDRTVETPFEYLSSYDNLLDWAVKVELLTASESKKLASMARENQSPTEVVLQKIIDARKILYHLFLAIAQNRTPGGETQARFNDLLREAMAHLKLQVRDGLAVEEQWQALSDLNYPLYPIIKSAYDLLISDRPDRIKECGACGWLFLDQSKNKSRKWCSMESCGSNVKAKRYYHRHKKKNET